MIQESTPNYTTETPYEPCTCSGWVDTRTVTERSEDRKKEILYSIASHLTDLASLIEEAAESI